jgi:hypothetical protein
MVVVIEDESHAEWQGTYATVDEAMRELVRRARVPWDEPPNRCPCISWRTCDRGYEIIEYDDAVAPWREVRRFGSLEVSQEGVVWAGQLSSGVLRTDPPNQPVQPTGCAGG